MVFLSTWFFSAYKIIVKINVDVWFEFNVDTYVGSIIPRPPSYEQVVNALQWELSSNSVDQLWIKIKSTQFASEISDMEKRLSAFHASTLSFIKKTWQLN